MAERRESFSHPPDSFASPLANAPAFGIFLGWCATVSCAETGRFPLWVVCLLSLFIAAGWVLFGTTVPNRSSLSVCAFLIPILLSGSFLLHGRVTSVDALPPRVESDSTVLMERQWGYGRMALVKTVTGVKYVLHLGRGGASIKPGDMIHFSGRTARFSRASAKSNFDEYLYWRAKGARCAIEDTAVTVHGRAAGLPAWREALSARIERSLPRRTAGYMLASWTGKRDAELESLHRAAGTSHLLAVSGFHIAVVAGIAARLLRGLRCRPLAVSILLWAYAALTGAAPSAVRAALMIQIVLLGEVVGRKGTAFNSTAAVGGIMLLCNPWFFWDVGWRLSMLAVLTLTAIAKTDRSNFAKMVWTSPIVWLATSIQATWTFGEVPVAGIIANYAALPVFAILLPVAFILSLPALVGLPGGDAAAGSAEFFFRRWEVFSGNIVYLIPWKISFSAPLALACALLLFHLFSVASGFSRTRALFFLFPAALGTLCLLASM